MTKLVVGVNDLETMRPDLAKEWDVEKNGGKLPSQYAYGSNYNAMWICPDHGHSYQCTISHRTNRGQGCSYCSGRKVLAGFNDLETTHPDIAKQWDYDKNEDKPSEVTYGSTKKRYWVGSCGHKWRATISSRTSGCGCPTCAKEARASRSRTPRKGKSLAEVFSDVANEWHPSLNGDKTPDMFSYGSGAVVWWLCPKGHAYDMDIHLRTNSGSGCPYCSGKRVLAGFNDIQTTDPDIANQWHPTKNETLKATDVSRGSHKKVWWQCALGHEWESTVADRCLSGNGCPHCHRGRHDSLSERAIAFYLSKHYPDLMTNCSPEGIDFGKSELDIYIPSKRTAVEYDGGRWHSDVERDLAKDKLCAENGISMIRVRDEKCPDYESTAKFIRRESDTGYATLDDAILKVLEALGIDDNDVDTRRDLADILEIHNNGCIERSLAMTHPDVADEWHPTKNGNLTPYMVYPKSMTMAWWVCPKGHEYQALVCNRSSGHGCWTCRNELISKQRSTPKEGHSLLERYPTVSSEWVRCVDDESRTPSTISYGSKMVVTWKCTYCKREYNQVVYHRTRSGDRLGCGRCKIGIAARARARKSKAVDAQTNETVGQQPESADVAS